MSLSNEQQEKILKAAEKILEKRFERSDYVSSPTDIKAYLRMKLAKEEREIFGVVFLDNRHGVLGYEELFAGTIDGAAIYVREVAKAALKYNAAAVVLSHNHPSGTTEQSQADVRITQRIKEGLEILDIRVLDHIIVGKDITSLAERGLI